MSNNNTDTNQENNTNITELTPRHLSMVDSLLLGEYIINRRRSLDNLRDFIDSQIINNANESIRFINDLTNQLQNSREEEQTSTENVEYTTNVPENDDEETSGPNIFINLTEEPVIVVGNNYFNSTFSIEIWDENSGLREHLEKALYEFRLDKLYDMIEDNEFNCEICYNTRMNKVTLACNHCLCFGCIQDWISHNKNTCPFCRYIFIN